MNGNGLAVLAIFVLLLYLVATNRLEPLLQAMGFAASPSGPAPTVFGGLPGGVGKSAPGSPTGVHGVGGGK